MGTSASSTDREMAQEVSDACFQKILDGAESRQQTSSQISTDTEQTLFLGVQDWHSDEPSIYLLLDERPFDKPFDGWLNAKQRTLEFRFKIPGDYPAHRASIPAYVKSLLSDRGLLGITTLYIGPGPVKQCTKILKKARSRRPQWSEPVSLYNAQFFWMKRSPRSPSVYVKMVVDSDEICMLVVSENSPAYKHEFGSDVHKFMQIVAVPLRIKLRAVWWKRELERYTAANELQSPKEPETQGPVSDKPEQQWWWPLVQAQEDKKNRAKVKTTEESEEQHCADAESEGDDSAPAGRATLFTASSSSLPQTPSSQSKKKNTKRKKNKKGFQTSLAEAPVSIPSEGALSSVSHPESSSSPVPPNPHIPCSATASRHYPSPDPVSSKETNSKASKSSPKPPVSPRDLSSKQKPAGAPPVPQPSAGTASAKEPSRDKQPAKDPTSKHCAFVATGANKAMGSSKQSGKTGTLPKIEAIHPVEDLTDSKGEHQTLPKARPGLQGYADILKKENKTPPKARPSLQGYAKAVKGELKAHPETGFSYQADTTDPKEERKESIELEASSQGGIKNLQGEQKSGPKAEASAQGNEQEEDRNQGQQARSQAITLIRARTVTRTTPSSIGASPTEDSLAQLARQSLEQDRALETMEQARPSKKKSLCKGNKGKSIGSHPAESSEPGGDEAHQGSCVESEHTYAQQSSSESHAEQSISVDRPSSTGQDVGQTPIFESHLEQHSGGLKLKQPPLAKTCQSERGHRGHRIQPGDHSSAEYGQSVSDPDFGKEDNPKTDPAHRLSAVHGQSPTPTAEEKDTPKGRSQHRSSNAHGQAPRGGTGRRDKSKIPVEHCPPAAHGQSSSGSVADTKNNSKAHVEHSSSTSYAQSSSDSTVETKDKHNVHLEHRDSTNHGGPHTKSRVSTEERQSVPSKDGNVTPSKSFQEVTSPKSEAEETLGKYDHLLGDPNLDLSGAKNKGRVESVSRQQTREATIEQKTPAGSPIHVVKKEESLQPSSKSPSSDTPAPSSKVSAPPSKALDPSSKAFTPSFVAPDKTDTELGGALPGRPRGSPIAIRCAEASDPESPVQTQSQPRRYAVTPERLPPIQEVSPPAAAGVVATPGSSTTAQTGWTGLGLQVTPDSNLTAEPSDSASGPIHRFSGAVSGPASSHAHPNTASDPGVVCAMAGCNARCNLWDGEAAICPRCGPHTEVRYCTQEHLHEDVKWHWVRCGRAALTHPCPANSNIPEQVREGVPLVPCLHGWDSPERHRQAVRFNTSGLAGDYFVFADWAELVEAGFPANSPTLRCSPRVVETIRFDGPEEKDRFRRVLAVCLLSSIENTGLVDYLFRLIRDALRSRAAWSAETDAALRLQFQRELQVTVRPEITGERHACEADWEGRNPRHCRDSVCRSERRYLLGDLGRGRGYRRLVDVMEASHWILRAARTTHPQVAGAAARMRGEGFPDVVDDERRQFRRGSGWDGPGAGDMEIEGINA